MSALGLALIAGLGAFSLFSGLTPSDQGLGEGHGGDRQRHVDAMRRRLQRAQTWLHQAGLDKVGLGEFVATMVVLFGLGSAVGFALFGGVVPALGVGGLGAMLQLAASRHRRQMRRQRAQDEWPRMIEEIRVQTSSLGRSIPQAVFDVGSRGDEELQSAFRAARREWLLTTDLAATFGLLKERLGDPTADATCETLLVAHELGGIDLDRRLEALAIDRRQDVQGRKDARSRQAGARFARTFVLLVPAGMALAGTSVGNGRDAYRTTVGQLVAAVAILFVIGCWLWAGRVMKLPDVERVFRD